MTSINEHIWGSAHIGLSIDDYKLLYENAEELENEKYSKFWLVIADDHYKAILKEEARNKIEDHLGIPLRNSLFNYLWIYAFKSPRKKFPWKGPIYTIKKVNSLTYYDVLDRYYSMTYQDTYRYRRI